MKKELMLFLSLSSILTACSSKAPVVTQQTERIPISFSWWGNDDRNEYTLQAVEIFEKLHPEIDVKCSYTEWSGYQVRTDVRMASGTEADVMQINFAWIDQYSPDGLGFYDLNTLTDTVNIDTIDEDLREYGMKNGHLNALPIAMNTQTVYLNRTVYNKYGLDIPRTWDDLFNSAKIMKGESYPLSMIIKSAWLFCIAYTEQTTGKKFINDDGSLGFNEEDIRMMIDFYCRMVNEKVIPNVEYSPDNRLESEKAAGIVAWLSDAENQCSAAIDSGYEITAADYIAFEGMQAGTGWYMKPATMYAISNSTKYPQESALLLDFLLNSPEMAKLQGLEKGIPLSKPARDTLEEEGMLSGIQYEAFERMQGSDMLSKMHPVMENSAVITAFNESCNEVLFGKSTSEERAKAVYEVLTSELGR